MTEEGLVQQRGPKTEKKLKLNYQDYQVSEEYVNLIFIPYVSSTTLTCKQRF